MKMDRDEMIYIMTNGNPCFLAKINGTTGDLASLVRSAALTTFYYSNLEIYEDRIYFTASDSITQNI